MAGVLIYSAKQGLALELISAARKIGDSVTAVSINDDSLAQALADAGARTFKISDPNLSVADTGAAAAAIKQVLDKENIDTVLLSSDRRGKELAGRVAQAIGAGCLTDVTSINVDGSQIECQRNALGGATIATQYIEGPKVIAIRPRAYEAAGAGNGSGVEEIDVEIKATGIKVIDFKPKAGDSVNIEAAEILVAVGQGLSEEAKLTDVQALAAKLGGEVACSKPVATDKKWLSEERIIGLSGKKCKPQLALLLGISGQVQFTVGIRDARIIAAVNTDENAAINYMADYILQADLHDVINELNQKL
ncbi:electron transfer flavoprotein, alpha subunit [hydrocarbon metagenome]|uniref:Electron transfer flavoprotein, alpha subunit n=1 Tax=hydrocarbon metagenome TaxID=938273 RepID=A0A0W8E3N1_9ZZZZ